MQKKALVAILWISIALIQSSCSYLPMWQSSFDTSFITKQYKDIPYASESTSQKMDIYLPEWAGKFPVIIAIHGWAFLMGNKEWWDLSAMIQGVKKWYAVVCVNYRLSDEAIFPAAIDDIQKAIIFLKENANKYQLNWDKMAVWWDSAGWNLASLAGTMWKVSEKTNVQAVVDWFGPIYFSTMDSEFKTLWVSPKMWITNTSDSPESKYLGKTIWTPEAEELVKQASPLTYISESNPPFLIQHGTADTNIPITQSENLSKALKKAIWDEKVKFDKIEWAEHGWDLFENTENLGKVFSFLDQYLK
jgi:acetyl esterase/lipase